MDITRKAFCEGLAAGSVLLLLQACGGGDGGSSSGPGFSGAACSATGAAIANNHPQPHALQIVNANDLVSGKPFDIQGQADHNHTVTFSDAQVTQLKAKQAVTVMSTVNGHSHAVTVTCV